MIEIQNIVKSFEDKTILEDVSARFEQGKTNLIIGQSGSGKTVTLKCIVGLFVPDSGHVFFDGRDFHNIKKSKEKKMIRREMGMLFQGSALFDWMSVEENVRFPLDMFTRMSAAEKQKRVDFCLDRVDILRAAKLSPGEISGGMQKRTAIARAIALNPKYLFCDEPNSGLDPKTALLIDKLIHELTQEFEMTTIVNTHDMNSVMEIGDHIVFINKGKKAWEGSNKEITESDNQELNDFIFASDLFKKVKKNIDEEHDRMGL